MTGDIVTDAYRWFAIFASVAAFGRICFVLYFKTRVK